VVIKSEPGLGKTRLALEFYRWLRETHGWMTKYYWPEASQESILIPTDALSKCRSLFCGGGCKRKLRETL